MKLAVGTTLARETASCVSEVRPTKYGVSIKLHDKVRALQLLGEHLGIFKMPTVPKGAVKDLTSRCKRCAGFPDWRRECRTFLRKTTATQSKPVIS